MNQEKTNRLNFEHHQSQESDYDFGMSWLVVRVRFVIVCHLLCDRKPTVPAATTSEPSAIVHQCLPDSHFNLDDIHTYMYMYIYICIDMKKNIYI